MRNKSVIKGLHKNDVIPASRRVMASLYRNWVIYTGSNIVSMSLFKSFVYMR